MLRNGVTGDWIGTFLGHKGAIWCSRISEFGDLAVTGSADFTANVWNVSNGQPIISVKHGHIVRSADLVVASGSRTGRLVTGGQDKLVKVWSFPSGEKELEWDMGSPVRSTIWISSTLLVVASLDGTISWWDVSSSSPTKLKELKVEMPFMQLEKKGNVLLIAAANSAYVLDSASGEITRQINLDYKISAFALNRDGTQFLTGTSEDTWVRLHDYASTDLLDTYKGHHGPVHSIAYSPDGAIAATGSEDGTIRLWKMVGGNYGLWSKPAEKEGFF